MPRLALVLLATALLAASCSGDDDESGETGETAAADTSALMIFAPTSVEDVFRELAPEAELRFGSAEELAAAVVDGEAVPDVFASAGQTPIADVGAGGILESPSVFATNRVVLVVPPDTGVESLEDLADAELLVGVELGAAAAALAAIGSGDLVEGADYDPTAADQVASGAAEAALVYYTDALAAGDGLRVIELPAQALVEYPIAVANVSERFEEAQAFVDLVLSDRGQQALEEAGFGPAPGLEAQSRLPR